MDCYNSYTNETLLELLAQNDQAAFTEIYHRYWQKLFVIAFNRVSNKDTAEDVVHDVFTSLWMNRTSKEIGALENYLAVAVKFTVFNKTRKQASETNYRNQLQHTGIIEMPVEDAVYFKQVMQIVQTEIEHLPEKCRLIFRYSREHNMPVKEIANRLHLSPKTVENQLGKAVRRLKLVTRSLLQSIF